MYYGNDEAESTSNGTATFVFYEDWTSEDLVTNGWIEEQSAGSVSFSASDTGHGYTAKFEGNADGVYQIWGAVQYDTTYALRSRSHIEATVASSQYLFIGLKGTAHTSRHVLYSNAGDDLFKCVDDDGNGVDAVASSYIDDWYIYDFTRTGTEGKVYVDGVLRSTLSLAPDTIEKGIEFYASDSEYDLYNDWSIIRKFVVVEPVVDSWGEEEDNLPPPEWNIVGEAELIFSVPIDESGLNILLIFLGLFMIPASTLYLVKGGRSEASMDKLFFGLIAFVIGWALFLGGIYG